MQNASEAIECLLIVEGTVFGFAVLKQFRFHFCKHLLAQDYTLATVEF